MADPAKDDTPQDAPVAPEPSRRALIAGIAALVGGALVKAAEGPAAAAAGEPVLVDGFVDSSGGTTAIFDPTQFSSPFSLVRFDAARPGPTMELQNFGAGGTLRLFSALGPTIEALAATTTAGIVVADAADLGARLQTLQVAGRLAGAASFLSTGQSPVAFHGRGQPADLLGLTLTAQPRTTYHNVTFDPAGSAAVLENRGGGPASVSIGRPAVVGAPTPLADLAVTALGDLGTTVSISTDLQHPAAIAIQGRSLGEVLGVTMTAGPPAAMRVVTFDPASLGSLSENLAGGTATVARSGPSGPLTAVLGTVPAAGKFLSEDDKIGAIAAASSNVALAAVSGGPLGAFIGVQPGQVALRTQGDVVVVGNLTATGGKAAAVRHPDGSHRLLHAVEAPEAWFEDFGRGRLRQGRARIVLDADFAGVVSRDYHVFLTPAGDCNGLYVESAGPTGFEVRELRGGASDVAFTYRVVARRADLAARGRMERIELPPNPV